MSDLTRRNALKALGLLPAAGALGLTHADVAAAADRIAALEPGPAAEPFAAAFFTPHELATVRVLVDLIIPKDERSGSATDAKVPEFMDFIMRERDEDDRVWMRGGLAWLDAESRHRFGTTFAASKPSERRAILDDIAWPAKARPEMSHGVSFFNRFRDLTATGFFSSAIGWQDLGYTGNVAIAEWTGCPPAALRKLGVSYGA